MMRRETAWECSSDGRMRVEEEEGGMKKCKESGDERVRTEGGARNRERKRERRRRCEL